MAFADQSSNQSSRQLIVVGNSGYALGSSAFGWNALLDLKNNDLDLRGVDLELVNSQVAQGYNFGNWNNLGGVISSTAGNNTTHLTALGVIQNNQSGAPIFTSGNLFDTIIPGPDDLLIKYTYYGDANLDGKIDGSDYSLVDNGALNALSGWYNGDFNYDGVINGADYTLIDNGFNAQVALSTTAAATLASDIALVPEPGLLPSAAFGALLCLRRCRMKLRVHEFA